ncbi:MAG: hypothetical protein V4671_13190, partial [Armatimonadota bacterium]
AGKNDTETGLTGSSRLALDETLYQIRGAKQVLPSYLSSTLSGANKIVLAAPGYNPSSSTFYLDGVTDYIIIWHESGKLLQTLVPGTGSVRPQRTKYVLASNVKSCAFSYRVRDYFTSGSKNNATFVLNGYPSSASTPLLYVNGVLKDFSFSSSTRTATVSLSEKSNDLQFVYDIDPTNVTNAVVSMPVVGEVGVTLQMEAKDNRQVTRNMTLHGAARLRNLRK